MAYTVWSKLVQGILNAANCANLDTDVILSNIGLNPSILHQVDGRISHEQLCKLWQEISRHSGEEAIGLRLATCTTPSATYDVINYALESCPNLKEALLRLQRYIRLVHEGAIVTLETSGNVARVTHTVTGVSPPLPGAACQWIIANFFSSICRITNLDFVPIRVGFQHPQPSDITLYNQLFRSPIVFAQPVNEICFDAKLLERPLLRFDPGLCVVLDRYATEMLEKLPQNESIVERVRRELNVRLQGGNPGLEVIAQTLGISARTLQRKLKEAGTSHQALLDEMRQELSIYYLKEHQMAVCEVAFLLGFSETSAFYRAFKRWTGKTPNDYRR